MKIEFDFLVIICAMLLSPLISSNHELRKEYILQVVHSDTLPDMKMQYFKDLDLKTKKEVDSMLKRLPVLKKKKEVKKLQKVKKILEELTEKSIGIPDSAIIHALEIKADTVDIIIPEIKEYKIPLFKRIFKQRKNKKK